jgi:hypothetical protein
MGIMPIMADGFVGLPGRAAIVCIMHMGHMPAPIMPRPAIGVCPEDCDGCPAWFPSAHIWACATPAVIPRRIPANSMAPKQETTPRDEQPTQN